MTVNTSDVGTGGQGKGGEGISGIDHCIVLVHDLDAARAQMERLGFATAPRGVHSEHMGTHNHCIMLERGYFEVLAVRHPTERNERWRDVLATREGLTAVACQTEDARSADLFFHSIGIESYRLLDFARPVELRSGPREARFTTLTLPADVAPVPMFLCQHHTRDVVWLPQYLNHPNGCVDLLGAVVLVSDPVASQERLAPAFADAKLEADEHTATICSAAGNLVLLTAAGLQTRYAQVPRKALCAPSAVALQLGVVDLSKTADFLRDAGVKTYPGPNSSLCVAPADACGAVLEFSEASHLI
jgi:hypothetical protein